MTYPLTKPLVLVGIMGTGKTALGTKLAKHYQCEFIDSDREIVLAAQMSINDIFEKFGEAHFRSGERRVIERILQRKDLFILASGGGAILNARTTKLLKKHAITLWLDINIDILWTP